MYTCHEIALLSSYRLIAARLPNACNGSKPDTATAPQITFLQHPVCDLSLRMKSHHIRFTPVELKARHDGWTSSRQIRFIAELAATRSITRACLAVGMTRTSAYKLRDRPDASRFRLAWKAALRPGFEQDRRRSPRALVRIRRMEGRDPAKVDEMEEMEAALKLTRDHQPTSSASETLQTYLASLREQEQELGSPRGRLNPCVA